MGEVCEKCGSVKILERPLADRMHDFGMLVGQATVTVEANPNARLFKGAVKGLVSLRFCCECGRAEIYVSNGKELWEAHLKRESARPVKK